MNDLDPISPKELQEEMAIHIAAMNARRDVGWCRVPEFFAKTLTERLFMSGLRPFRIRQPAHVSAHSKFAGTSCVENSPRKEAGDL